MDIKRVLLNIKWKPLDLLNKANMRCRHISYGYNLKTLGRMFIRGTGRISIGDNVTFNSCTEANPIGGDYKTILYTKKNGIIRIGNHVGISNSAIVALGIIEIEDDVLIGGDCRIYDHDFHSLDYTTRMLHDNEGVEPRLVHIKKGAFIGGHSIILKGVTVGEKAIVGAGSVVTKSIPDGEIWAGNPARYIKRVKDDTN